MGTKVDKRIVQMNFDNAKFEKGVRTTLNSIAKLKSSLKFDGASKSIKALEKAGGNFNLRGIENSLNMISKRFSTFGIIGTTVLQELTKTAMNAGSKITSALTGQIITGGKTRALNIEQAKFMFEGLGMDIEASMASANAAVKGTAYGLDQAAKAAGQFGATGLRAGDDMTSALRAIAGVASMTSSEYDDIANIFTAVAGQGRVMGDQLLQLSGRGINAAAILADQLGMTEKKVRDLVSDGKVSFEVFYKAMDNAFGKQATKANKTFTGALSNMKAALSRIGADVATPGIENLRKAINKLTPVIDSVHEALKPLIGSIEKTIVLASKSARKFLSGINEKDINRIGKGLNNLYISAGNTFKFIGEVFESFTDGLKEAVPAINALDFKKATKSIKEFTAGLKLSDEMASKFKMIGGSISNVVISIMNIAKAMASVIRPAIDGVIDAFNQFKSSSSNLLPGGLIETIYDLTSKFKEFTAGLKISDDTAVKVRETFKTIFSILFSGIGVVTNIAKVIGVVLFGALKVLSPIGKAVLTIFGGISNVLLKMVSSALTPAANGLSAISKALVIFSKGAKDSLENSKALQVVMSAMETAGNIVYQVFKELGNIISSILSGGISSLIMFFGKIGDKTQGVGENIRTAAGSINSSFKTISGAFETTRNSATRFFGYFKAGLKAVLDFLSPFIEMVKRVVGQINLEDILNVGSMMTGVKIFSSIEKSFKSFEKIVAGSGIPKALEGVKNALLSYQKNLQADTLKKLGVAVALLAGSILALSLVDPTKLTTSFAAMSGLLGELVIAMKVINDLKVKDKDIIKVSASMVLVAASLDILAGALKKLEGFTDLGSIAPALLGITALLTGITIAMKSLIKEMEQTTKDNLGSEMIKVGVAMITISAALNLLASACSKLGSMDGGSLLKGAGAVVVLMASLSKFKNIYSDGSYAGMALTIMAVSTSMLILHKAITKFAEIPLEEMNTGLNRVKKILIGLFAFLKGLENAKMEGVASTIIAVGVALNLLLVPIKVLGNMDFGALVQGLVATGLALAGFVVALRKLDDVKISGGTAGAILALSVALVALTIPITVLGALPWQVVALGIAAVVGSVALLGGILAVLSPAASGMMAVSAAFAVFGGAIALVGAGVLAFSAGLTLLATSSGLTTAALMAFLGVLPAIIAQFSAVLNAIAQLAPGIGESLKTIGLVAVDVLSTVANELAVKLVELLGLIVQTIAEQIIQNGPIVVQAIGNVVRSLIDEISKTIPNIVALGVTMITELAKGFANASSQLVKSGVTIIKNFLKGVQQLTPEFVKTGVTIITEFLKGVEKTVPQLLKTATTIVKEFLKTIRDLTPDIIETGFKVLQGFLDGIRNHIKDIVKTAADIVTEFLDGIAEKLPQIIDSGMNLMISFIEGLAKGIDENGDRAVNAVFDLFESIVKLIIKVLKELPARLLEWGAKAIKGFIKGIKDFKKNVGPTIKDIMDGIVKTLKELPGKLVKAGRDAIKGFINGIKDKIKNVKDAAIEVGKNTVDSIKDFLGIHSPSRVFKLIGNQTVEGYVNGIVEKKHTVVAAMKVIAEPTKKFAEDVVKNMAAGGSAVKQFYKDLKGNGATTKEFNTAIKNMAVSMDAFTKSLYKNSQYYQEDLNNVKELSKKYKDLQKEEKELRKEQSKKAAEYKKAQTQVKKNKSKDDDDKKGDDPLLKILEARQKKSKETDKTVKVVGGSISKTVEKVTSVVKKSDDERTKSSNKTTETKKKNAKLSIDLDEKTSESSKKSSSSKKKSAESEKKAYQTATKNLKKNLKEQEQARKDIAKAEEQILKNQQKALKDWQNNIKEAMKSFTDLTSMTFETGLDLTGAFEIDTSMTTADALKNSAENLAGYKKWLQDLKALSAMGYDEAIVQTVKDAGYQNQTYLKALMGATEDEVNQFNKDLRETQNLSADKLISDAKEKAEKVKKWSDNLKKMSMLGFSQELIKSLAEAGPEASAEIVDVYANMTKTQVREINKYEKTSAKAISEAVDQITYATAMAGNNSASKAVKEFTNGYSKSVDKDFEPKAKKALDKSMSSLSKNTNKKNKKMGKESGKSLITSFSKSIEEGGDLIDSSARTMLDDVKNTLSNFGDDIKISENLENALKKFGWDTGSAVGDGVDEGLEESMEKIKASMKDFSDKIKSSLEDYLDVSKLSLSTNITLTGAFEIDTSMTTADALKNSAENLAGYKKWLQDLKALSAMGYDEAIVQTVKDAGYQNQTYLKALMGATEDEVNQFNKDLRETQNLSADKLISDAKEKAEKVKKWSDNLKKMSMLGFSQELIKSLAEAGPEASAEIVDVYANMTKTQVREINKYEKTSAKAISEAVDQITYATAMAGNEAAERAVGEFSGLSKLGENYQVSDKMYDTLREFGEEMGSAIGDGIGEGVNASSKEAEKAIKELYENVQKSVESYIDPLKASVSTGIDIFKEFTVETELTGAQLLENMKSQVNGVAQWKNDLNALAEQGLAPEIIEKLRELGPSSAEQIKAFKEMTLSEIQAANDAMTAAISMSADQVLEEQRRKTEQAVKWSEDMAKLAGMGISEGLIKGLAEQGIDGSSEMIAAYLTMSPEQIAELNSNYEKALEVSNKIAKTVSDGYASIGKQAVDNFADGIAEIANEQDDNRAIINEAMEEVSTEVYERTTESFYETGKEADKELADALTDYKNKPTYAATKVSSSVYSGITTNLNYSSGMTVGLNMTDGLADGILSGKSRAVNAAIDVAQATLDAAKEALDINSPSKKFIRIGLYSMLGMAKGIKDNGSKPIEESESTIQRLIDATYSAISKANFAINDAIDTNPVITPIINMDKAMSGVKRLNSELTRNSFIAMDRELNVKSSKTDDTSAKANSITNVENNYNFTQNNTSPKALSRIDIYRDTRSQFSQFRRAVQNA